jgi:hypothetical protein
MCRHTPEAGAVCGKAARTDLGGGRAMKRTSLPLLKRREFITLLGGTAAARRARAATYEAFSWYRMSQLVCLRSGRCALMTAYRRDLRLYALHSRAAPYSIGAAAPQRFSGVLQRFRHHATCLSELGHDLLVQPDIHFG